MARQSTSGSATRGSRKEVSRQSAAPHLREVIADADPATHTEPLDPAMPTTGNYRIGMSGWTHHAWRGIFYPTGLAPRYELAYASHRLNSLEITSSFFALQRPSSFHAWYEATPEDFVFAVTGPRFITHQKELRNTQTPLANFFASGPLALRQKLGPILWQLPASLELTESLAEHFVPLLPRTTQEAAQLARHHDLRLRGRACTTSEVDQPLRYAIEVTHPAGVSPAVGEILHTHNVALVVNDVSVGAPHAASATAPATDCPTTADFCYLRLHGTQFAPGGEGSSRLSTLPRAIPRPRPLQAGESAAPAYSDSDLEGWARFIRGWSPPSQQPTQQPTQPAVYAYLTNESNLRAPFDAIALATRLGISQPVFTSMPRPRLRLAR